MHQRCRAEDARQFRKLRHLGSSGVVAERGPRLRPHLVELEVSPNQARVIPPSPAAFHRSSAEPCTTQRLLKTSCRTVVRPDSVQVPGETLAISGCPPVALVWL